MQDNIRKMLQQTSRINEASLEFRPMPTSQIMELALKVYRYVGIDLVKATFPGAVMVFVACTFLFTIVLPGMIYTRDPDSLQTQSSEVAIMSLLGVFLVLPVLIIGLSIIVARTTAIVWRYVEFQEQTPLYELDRHTWSMTRLAFVTAMKCSWMILVALLLVFLGAMNAEANSDLSAVLGGLSILLGSLSAIYALILIFRNLLTPIVLVVEGLDGKQAMRRSLKLLGSIPNFQPSGYDVFLTLTIHAVIYFALIFGGLYALTRMVPLEKTLSGLLPPSVWSDVAILVLQQMPVFFAVLFVLPFFGVGATVAYAERRARLEGFDIAIQHRHIRAKSRR